ncbi:MAG: PRC-barrel domain-containing protein [Candidatus Kerfeldbacteria bacterium]|nr:PRC-barrel domain-containing protein [Candidatus Kerfeldbacteria bacterium]
MRITLNQLHNLPVETQSGEHLGRVVDVELDADRHEVVSYYVKTKSLLPGLFEQLLIVDRRQVVSITPEKLVVEDAVSRDAERGSVVEPEPNAPAG